MSGSEIRDADVTPIGVTGANLCHEGAQDVEFSLHGYKFEHQFYVCSLPTDADGLVATGLLLQLKARLDLDNLTCEVRATKGQKRDVKVLGTEVGTVLHTYP
jgi:hypothetical protein